MCGWLGVYSNITKTLKKNIETKESKIVESVIAEYDFDIWEWDYETMEFIKRRVLNGYL